MTSIIDKFKSKKIIASLILGVIALVFLFITVKVHTQLIRKPKTGQEAPRYYSTEELTDESRLTAYGASSSSITAPSKYKVKEHLTLENIPLDGFERQTDTTFTVNDDSTLGALTFRGNNLRNQSCFGDMSATSGTFSSGWDVKLGESIAIKKDIESSTQPLVITWDREKMGYLKLEDNKRTKEALTEVIVTDMSGNISFYDLEDGAITRKSININVPIVGTATISPDGTPLLVVGAGGNSDKEVSKIVVINLYNLEVIKEFGERYNYAAKPAEECYNFSSSAVISADGDCLVYQGENGVTYSYTIKKSLSAGDLSASFVQELKYTYSTGSNDNNLGFTNSVAPAAFGEYVFQCDNNGNLVCLNVNSQKMIWVRNLGKTILSSPVLEHDKNTGHVYLYIGTAISAGTGNGEEKVYMYKLNASNGDIIWEREEMVKTSKKVNSGVVGTPLLGDNNLSDYIYFTVNGVDSSRSSKLICINKNSGEQKYYVRFKNYIYSSPAVAYGGGYIIVCDNKGNIFSLEGITGKNIDIKRIGERITSSPIVYNNTLLVVSDERIYGIGIK